MLTDKQLKELLTSTESDRIERTIATSKTVKFREAICSFANDMPEHGKPGYLLIGINDDGTLNSGVQITDQLMKDFASYRDDGHILPQPMMKVFKQKHPNGGEFLIVEVQPSDLPPVRHDGRVDIRVGPRRARANETEERRLIERRSANFRTFDITPCPDATLEELDLEAFQNTYRRDAVLHRDYQSNQPARFYQFSNRIEIQNPGGLYGDARPENFPRVNDYRNPVLAEAMAVLGYANRFGRGVVRAQKLLEENGSSAASFNLETTHFLATIPKHPNR